MAISLAPAALAHLRTVREKMGTDIALRVTVKSGGCSGLRYIFSVESVDASTAAHPAPDDIPILVDPLSLSFIDGAVVNYEETMMEARLFLTHAGFTATCGCGSSFSAA